jgi:hypothetical protein
VGARHVIFRDGMVAGARPDFAWGKRRRVSPCDHKREGDIKQHLPEVRRTGSAAARSAQAAALAIAKVNSAELRMETGVDDKLSRLRQIDVGGATAQQPMDAEVRRKWREWPPGGDACLHITPCNFLPCCK